MISSEVRFGNPCEPLAATHKGVRDGTMRFIDARCWPCLASLGAGTKLGLFALQHLTLRLSFVDDELLVPRLVNSPSVHGRIEASLSPTRV